MKKILILLGLVCAGYFGVKDSNLHFFKNYMFQFYDNIFSSYIFSPSNSKINSPKSTTINSGCKIKGNISISSGRKIYHVPGQQDYENTRIQPEHGERWFCTEQEALNAGWRKAPR